MNNAGPPIETFKEFFEEHLPHLENTYSWPIGDKAKKSLPSFPWQEWHKVSGSLNECVALKQHLTGKWNSANTLERAEMARWIVSDWGGVRANKQDTLESYLNLILSNNSQRPLKGVASYSKILSAANHTQDAIYDARVAACLNAVQLLMEPEKPYFFHYVPSRNKIIQNFADKFPKRILVNERKWVKQDSDTTYMTYRSLLHDLKDNHFPDKEIYHFEMTLFSLGPQICGKHL